MVNKITIKEVIKVKVKATNIYPAVQYSYWKKIIRLFVIFFFMFLRKDGKFYMHG